MTNAEYNEFAKKVLEEVDKIKFENEKKYVANVVLNS